jgi:hypothetical protein
MSFPSPPASGSEFGRSPEMGLDSHPIVRPRTAGEASSRRHVADMLLGTGSPIEITADQDTFRFPTPAKRPATAAAHRPRLVVPAQQHRSIGLALGSPSDSSFFSPSAFATGVTSSTTIVGGAPTRSRTTREGPSSSRDDNTSYGGRPLLSRWRSIGSLWGRRRAATFQGLRSESQASVHTEPDARIATLDRAPSSASSSQHSSPFNIGSPPGLFRSFTRKKSRKGDRAAPEPPPKGPMLDVEIPEATMERYSKFFQEVQVLPARSSSLLARRQDKPGNALKVWQPDLSTAKAI